MVVVAGRADFNKINARRPLGGGYEVFGGVG